ncbi:MAG: CHC2 zinc finger domain-containing protein [Smithella sp.]|jgi:hypothetical protein
MKISDEQIKRAKQTDLSALFTQDGRDYKKSGSGILCRCFNPSHEDKNPSLSAGVQDGIWQFNCFSCEIKGTAIDYIMITRGMDFKSAVEHLAGPDEEPVKTKRADPAKEFFKKFDDLKKNAPHLIKKKEKFEEGFETFDRAIDYYLYKHGGTLGGQWSWPEPENELFRKVRINHKDKDGKDKKTFVIIHRNGARWFFELPEQEKIPLYRISEIKKSAIQEIVIIKEGENKLEKLRELGFQGTCVLCGAKSAAKMDWKPLAGRQVCIMPDNDKASEVFVKAVVLQLAELDPKPQVKVLRLKELWPEIPPKGDAVEFIENRRKSGRNNQAIKDEILKYYESLMASDSESSLADIYYDNGKKEFLRKNDRGDYQSLTEAQLKQQLAYMGFQPVKFKGETVSEINKILIDIRNKNDVNYAGSLAGWKKGLFEINSSRILITEAPRLIEPADIDYSVILSFISQLFDDPEEGQLPYFLGWMKVAYDSLKTENFRPGQMVALAGPHNCGKSFLQQMITEILGGRAAKPYSFLIGKTDFNADLFSAEHLCIEDEVASTDIRARRAFGSSIKQLTACDTQRLHAKGRQAMTLSPFWRCTISLNDEPENLMVLPPMDESIADKIMLFKVSRVKMPMPTATNTDRSKLWHTIKAQIPGFLNFLINWTIPDNLISERYGIAHYHHPDLIGELENLSPEFQLLKIINHEIEDLWTGSAEDLERKLTTQGDHQMESRRLLNWQNSCGTYLGRLSKKFTKQFATTRMKNFRFWTIYPQKIEVENERYK